MEKDAGECSFFQRHAVDAVATERFTTLELHTDRCDCRIGPDFTAEKRLNPCTNGDSASTPDHSMDHGCRLSSAVIGEASWRMLLVETRGQRRPTLDKLFMRAIFAVS